MTQKIFGALLGAAFMLPAAISFSLWKSKGEKAKSKTGIFETPADAAITLGLAAFGLCAFVFYAYLLVIGG